MTARYFFINIFGYRVGAENIHALRDDIQCFALMTYAFGDDMHGFAVICALRNVWEGLAPPEQKTLFRKHFTATVVGVGASTTRELPQNIRLPCRARRPRRAVRYRKFAQHKIGILSHKNCGIGFPHPPQAVPLPPKREGHGYRIRKYIRQPCRGG